MLKDPLFFDGLGLTIHIRTTIRYSYSYIESAAIKIGDDIFEIGSWGDYLFNGVAGANLPFKMADKFPMTYEHPNKNVHQFKLAITKTENIIFKTFKDMVIIKISDGLREALWRQRRSPGRLRTRKQARP
jgi:hypothetical protein